MVLLSIDLLQAIFNFFFGLLGLLFVFMIINIWSPNKWFCNFWGWHKAPNRTGFDGASFNGTCPRCGKEVMQDSQGNWF